MCDLDSVLKNIYDLKSDMVFQYSDSNLDPNKFRYLRTFLFPIKHLKKILDILCNSFLLKKEENFK